jgi:hypothetical protein
METQSPQPVDSFGNNIMIDPIATIWMVTGTMVLALAIFSKEFVRMMFQPRSRWTKYALCVVLLANVVCASLPLRWRLSLLGASAGSLMSLGLVGYVWIRTAYLALSHGVHTRHSTEVSDK